MIPDRLTDYIKVYEDFLDGDLCKRVVNELEKADWHQNSFYRSKDKTLVSHKDDLAISHDKIDHKDVIDKKLWSAVERYILKDFSCFKKWFDGWNGYTHTRFNRYDVGTKMKLHCDHIQSMFDGERKGIPILSMVGVLNDDFEGGEFVMFGDKKIELKAGSLLMFPSTFMFPHEVKPVKDGVRYSYVSWVW